MLKFSTLFFIFGIFSASFASADLQVFCIRQNDTYTQYTLKAEPKSEFQAQGMKCSDLRPGEKFAVENKSGFMFAYTAERMKEELNLSELQLLIRLCIQSLSPKGMEELKEIRLTNPKYKIVNRLPLLWIPGTSIKGLPGYPIFYQTEDLVFRRLHENHFEEFLKYFPQLRQELYPAATPGVTPPVELVLPVAAPETNPAATPERESNPTPIPAAAASVAPPAKAPAPAEVLEGTEIIGSLRMSPDAKYIIAMESAEVRYYLKNLNLSVNKMDETIATRATQLCQATKKYSKAVSYQIESVQNDLTEGESMEPHLRVLPSLTRVTTQVYKHIQGGITSDSAYEAEKKAGHGSLYELTPIVLPHQVFSSVRCI